MSDKDDTPVNLDDTNVYKTLMLGEVQDHGRVLEAHGKTLAEIRGAANFAKWVILPMIVLVSGLIMYIYKGDVKSIHDRLDKFAKCFNIDAHTADIDKPETNTP